MKQQYIMLPRTEKEFDELVNKVCAKYKLENKEHAASVIAIRISHMPPDQATATLEYFGHCVIKNIAYQIAQNRCEKIQHKQQILALEELLKANPNDQQAIDALQKAASAGSELAKQTLDKYIGTPEELKTVS